MEERHCHVCGPLPADRFYPSSRANTCKACQNAARTERARANPALTAKVRRRRRLATYGLTPEDYDALEASQDGQCPICRQTGGETAEDRLGVDHDHATGRVRGLLCRPCNRAIGILADDPERCRRAAEYLERGQTA